ncbi:MAG: hypothetical protein KC649_05810, partial [Candidatus Omnitrophica bacterium]|nr:hypothetical protein [Candidatus Omnitrophota bacterium]
LMSYESLSFETIQSSDYDSGTQGSYFDMQDGTYLVPVIQTDEQAKAEYENQILSQPDSSVFTDTASDTQIEASLPVTDEMYLGGYVQILEPAAYSELSGVVSIKGVFSEGWNTGYTVEFRVDNQPIGMYSDFEGAHFQIDFDTAQLPDGPHNFMIQVRPNEGYCFSESCHQVIEFISDNDEKKRHPVYDSLPQNGSISHSFLYDGKEQSFDIFTEDARLNPNETLIFVQWNQIYDRALQMSTEAIKAVRVMIREKGTDNWIPAPIVQQADGGRRYDGWLVNEWWNPDEDIEGGFYPPYYLTSLVFGNLKASTEYEYKAEFIKGIDTFDELFNGSSSPEIISETGISSFKTKAENKAIPFTFDTMDAAIYRHSNSESDIEKFKSMVEQGFGNDEFYDEGIENQTDIFTYLAGPAGGWPDGYRMVAEVFPYGSNPGSGIEVEMQDTGSAQDDNPFDYGHSHPDQGRYVFVADNVPNLDPDSRYHYIIRIFDSEDRLINESSRHVLQKINDQNSRVIISDPGISPDIQLDPEVLPEYMPSGTPTNESGTYSGLASNAAADRYPELPIYASERKLSMGDFQFFEVSDSNNRKVIATFTDGEGAEEISNRLNFIFESATAGQASLPRYWSMNGYSEMSVITVGGEGIAVTTNPQGHLVLTTTKI